MAKYLFHSTDKGQSNEDWFYLLVDDPDFAFAILHSWSHGKNGSDGLRFESGEMLYDMAGFKKDRPREHAILVAWLEHRLK